MTVHNVALVMIVGGVIGVLFGIRDVHLERMRRRRYDRE